MPAVIETTEPTPKFAARVDEQIAEATSRIRGHDLAFGGLLVGGLVLGYAAGMIVLDKTLVLPEWLRQLSLLAFVAAVGTVAYRRLVRPLRQRINPLYAAVAVERTIDDAKNSVVGYVEARERGDVHAQVKAAMGARAARAVDEADVNHAVDHRGLAYAGVAVVALFLTLVVLFFVYRPTQFQSLLGRAFVPFSADAIASRTQVSVVEPQGGDVTVTSGQSLTIRVEVTGRIPKPDRPDRPRLLLRYTPTATEFDEVPLEAGERASEWFIQLRPDQLRTGVWYTAAAGDGETPEHRVTVRTAPLFTDFEVGYEFPAYTCLPPDASTDPHLRALRNTKVSVTAKANRPVRDGRAAFEPPTLAGVVGKAVPGRPDALRFDFHMTQPGSYKLAFTAGDGERSADSLPFGIKVDEDIPPLVDVTRPEPDDVTIAANGLLGVDGVAGDDYGLDKLTLKLKLVAPAERPLADRPYLGGKSFRRDVDGTYPRNLEYKDSVELAKVADPAGVRVELKEGMVLEYWLEATDNRTKPGPTGFEPDPNVGKSKVKRVRLAPPVEAPDQKQEQDDRRDQRKTEEQKHAADQQQKLNQENRPHPQPDPKAQPPKKDNTDPKANDAMPPMGDPGGMKQDGMKQDGMKQDGMANKADGMSKMPPEGKQDGMGKMPPEGKQDGMKSADPMPGAKDGMGNMSKDGMGMPMTETMGNKGENPQQAPMPSEPGRKDVQDQASKVQDQLNQERNGGGSPKSPPTAKDDERTNPADQKTNPPTEGMPPEMSPKTNDGGMGASETRPEGKVQPPDSPSNTKTEPKTGEPMTGAKSPDQRPSETRNDPLGGEPGAERETPKSGMPPMGDPMMKGGTPPDKGGPPKGDPSAGGEPKPATQQKTSDGSMGDPMMGKQPEPNPAADAGRAKTAPPSNDRGMDREPQPKNGNPPPDSQPAGGDAKAERPPEPGSVRPMPKSDDPAMPESKGNDAKAGDPMANAAEPRPGPSSKMGDPKMGDPKMGDPKMGDPKMGDPKMGDPKMGDPKMGDPKMGDPKMGDPKMGDPKMGDPKMGDPSGMGTKSVMPEPKSVEPGMERPSPSDMQPGGAAQQAPMPKSVDPNSGGAKQTDPKAGPEAGPMTPMPMPGGMGKDDPTGKNSKGGPPPKLDPMQKAELEQAARDLNSKDPVKQQDAREKLDRALGKDARQKAEDIAKGLNSDDPAERERAQQQLDDLRRQAEQKAGKEPDPKGPNPMPMPMPGGMTDSKAGPMTDTDPKGGTNPKVDPKEIEGALRDLNSKDEAKQKAARDRLDKAVGEQARREAEQLQNDLNSDDPARQQLARERLEEMRRQMEQQAKNNAPGKGGKDDDRFREGGGVTPNNAKAMDDDPRNRAKSAQLNLDQFEKNRFNRDLQDRLGWTQEQYDRFLADYRREAERLRREADTADAAPMPSVPSRPIDINSGGKIDGSPAAGPGTAGVGGPAFAAPGFGDALRRFQQGATQRPPAKRP